MIKIDRIEKATHKTPETCEKIRLKPHLSSETARREQDLPHFSAVFRSFGGQPYDLFRRKGHFRPEPQVGSGSEAGVPFHGGCAGDLLPPEFLADPHCLV